MVDGGGGEAADGGGSDDWLPIFDRVEAMLGKSQSEADAFAADRARLAAADKVQRESLEAARRLQRSVEELQAAAREKDAEMDSLRAEAANARKKLQADGSRKIKWEAAYLELLLGANQKLAELRDGDFEDSRACAETPNSKLKGVESCGKLSQNTMDQKQVASNIGVELRKLKQAYGTLSSNKGKEVSVLLSERDSMRNQLDIMQQEYAVLLKKNEVEATEASEAALMLQQSVDELKVLAQKKDDEIDILRGEALGAKKKLRKIYSLIKDKNDEIQRLKGQYRDSSQNRNNDTNETHKKSRCGDPALTIREMENNDLRHTLEEDSISETKTVENSEHDETTQKRRRASSMTNDDEKIGINENDDEQIGSGEDGDKQRASDEDAASDADVDEHVTSGDDDGQSRSNEHDEDGDKHMRSDEDGDEQIESDEDGDAHSTSRDDDGQSRSNEHDEDEDEHKKNESDEKTTNNLVHKPPGNPKRKRDTCSAQIANGKSHNGSNGVAKRRWSNKPPPSPLRRRRLVFADGQCSMVPTGNWAQYVNDVKDSLADQPDKRKKFKLFLWKLEQHLRFGCVIKCMEGVLDGHPELIRRLNEFLPNQYHIGVEKKPRIRNRGRYRPWPGYNPASLHERV